MKYPHQLTSKDQDFLSQDRTDPITGEKIEEGHTVVICAACKSAFFIESWEYLGDSHCDQTNTLEALPKSQNLYLQTNSKYTQEILTFGFSNKPMFKTSKGGFVAFIVAGVISSVFGAFIGLLSGEGFVGVIVFIVCLFLLSILLFFLSAIISVLTPNPTKNKSIKQIENMKATFSMCIDYKNKGFLINHDKPKNRQKFISFEEITEFKYHILYHPSTDIDALFCQLQIRINTKTRADTCFATIHRDTIPEWSNFISKLPTSLRIINTAFV
jgi:hypothetical protein